ncbi:MAG: ISKra4 family transposase [Gammaproteobacteria bacterium]|nr:ISKra4 family transposase [Gammaproteobacteria bacterium]
MTIVCTGSGGSEEFEAAMQYARQMACGLAGEVAQRMTHGEAEKLVRERGQEFMRLLYQGFLNLRAAREERQSAVVGEDEVVRVSRRRGERSLMSLFGEVTVKRRAYEHEGVASLHPLDAALNLPEAKYSHGLERLVAREVAKGAVDGAVALVDEVSGGHVPKRQVLEMTAKAARDFGLFHEQGQVDGPPDEDGQLLVLTTDGKGIVMRPEGLREATRAAAARERHKKTTRLSKGEKKNRKRMATVAAVYGIEPQPRRPEEILAHPEEVPVPARKRPRNKRVWASVERAPERVIEEMIEEASRRDPGHKRQWVVLVDGDPRQLRHIRRALKRCGVEASIVLDFIHVLEYLWKAAYCFFAEDDPAVEGWVLDHALAVLRGEASQVAAGMRRSATLRGLSARERKPIDRCAGYLLKYKGLTRYDRYLAEGFPIATGVIEGACRHLVKDRLEITGARWSLPGAEAVLKLRSLHSSGDFDEYFIFHQRQEHERNYASKIKGLPLARAA